MTTKHKHDNPILVTGAAGAVGGIGRNLQSATALPVRHWIEVLDEALEENELMAAATPAGSSQNGLWPRPSKIFDLSARQRIAQRLAHGLLHDGILAAPDEQGRRLEARQRALQVGVGGGARQRLIEDREPDLERNGGRVPAAGGG